MVSKEAISLKSLFETQVIPNLDNIAKWLENGATALAVAKKLKIGYSTLRRWLSRGEAGEAPYDALYAVFLDARAIADEAVEHALFDRACGFSYDEETYEPAHDPETGKQVMVLKKRVKKFMPPDTGAVYFWLTNRMRGMYQYKPEPEVSAQEIGGGVVEIPAVEGIAGDDMRGE